MKSLVEKVANRHDAKYFDVLDKYKEIADKKYGATSPLILTEEEFREAWRETNAHFARQ